MRGMDAFRARLQPLPGACRRAAEKALSQTADAVLHTAQGLVPVRTGYLRSTLHRKSAGGRHQVSAACRYALYVEKGTRRMRARPYLAPALQKANYHACIAQAIREAIR